MPFPSGPSQQRRGAKVVQAQKPANVDLNYIAVQLQELIDVGRQLVDAVYNSAVLTNAKAFAFMGEQLKGAALTGLATGSTTATSGVSVYKNQQRHPVILYVRIQGAETGEVAFLYLSVSDPSQTTQSTARFATGGLIPEASVIVPAGSEVAINGTAANSTLTTANVTGFTLPLPGATVLEP
jgi:hypothetical protein